MWHDRESKRKEREIYKYACVVNVSFGTNVTWMWLGSGLLLASIVRKDKHLIKHTHTHTHTHACTRVRTHTHGKRQS